MYDRLSCLASGAINGQKAGRLQMRPFCKARSDLHHRPVDGPGWHEPCNQRPCPYLIAAITEGSHGNEIGIIAALRIPAMPIITCIILLRLQHISADTASSNATRTTSVIPMKKALKLRGVLENVALGCATDKLLTEQGTWLACANPPI